MEMSSYFSIEVYEKNMLVYHVVLLFTINFETSELNFHWENVSFHFCSLTDITFTEFKNVEQ